MLLALVLLCCCAVVHGQSNDWQVFTVPGWYSIEAPTDWVVLEQEVLQQIMQEVGQESPLLQLGASAMPDNFRALESPTGDVILTVSVQDYGILIPAVMVEFVIVPGTLGVLRGQDPHLHWERAPGMYPAGERTFWRIDGVFPEGTTRKSVLLTQQGSRTIQLIFTAEVGTTYTGADLGELIHHVASTLVLVDAVQLRPEPAGS